MGEPENPSAFPAAAADCNAYDGQAGMTLRDWFAGQVLAGYLADPAVPGDPAPVAQYAYDVADAMLAVRQPVPEAAFAEVYSSCGHPVGAAECAVCMPF